MVNLTCETEKPYTPNRPILKDYLDFLIDLKSNLEIDNIFCHNDQYVFYKISQIMWKKGDKYKGVINIMGSFHIILINLKILYKKYEFNRKKISTISGVLATEVIVNREVNIRGDPKRGGYNTFVEAIDYFALNTNALAKLRFLLMNRLRVKTSDNHREFSYGLKKIYMNGTSNYY